MRRYNPFDEIEQFFERMSRQFDEMNRGFGFDDDRRGFGFDDDRRGFGFDGDRSGNMWMGMGGHDVAIDVADGGTDYVVTADLPGFEKEDIDLSISERTLTISAEREEDRESGDESSTGSYLRRERRRASVRRSIALPEDVDADGASAAYSNGVLTVTLPKTAVDDEDSHHIDIN